MSRYDINFLKGVKEEDAKEALEIAQKNKIILALKGGAFISIKQSYTICLQKVYLM